MTKEELEKYYIIENHSRTETADHFNISDSQLKRKLREFDMKKDKSLSLKNRYKPTVSKDEIIRYYIEENHTRDECLKHFNLTMQVFKRYLKEYGIKKDKKLVQKNIEKHFGARSPFALKQIQEKIKEKNKKNLGVEYPFQSVDIQNEIKQIMIEQYGYSNPGAVPKIREQIVATCLDRYGVENPGGLDWVQDKIKTTMFDRYGTTSGFALVKSKESKPNREFKKLLSDSGISFSQEYVLSPYRYDFKVDNILIEINPTATHNTIWSPFDETISPTYHFDKTRIANENNFRCIHVWDWDNKDAIIKLLLPRESVQARKCDVKEVPLKDAKKFINENHIQKYARDSIRLGLYYNDELVSIMTFGKARYNKKFEYELVRYCSSKNVIGGAEKLFKHFLDQYNPKSVCSYCDNSKFSGDTYLRLGFKKLTQGVPTIHWYNVKTKKHITDNLLRQRGYDQLFGTDYGKGTSNQELMLANGFVKVYDCGQSLYVLEREN